MFFMRSSFLTLASCAVVTFAQDCPQTWVCRPTASAPTLDGDLGEWTAVESLLTPLKNTAGTAYIDGDATYKCLYDDEKIYFSMEIPGRFRFSTEDNHLCAAVATMFKVGVDATYLNMGGCPEAMGGCNATTGAIPDVCYDHRVDIGGHWELKGTQQGTFYGMNSVQEGRATGGDDLVANKDDEYAVSSYCRLDDDDANSGNEWEGAWAHTNPTEGEDGVYIFEMSRLLKTPSEFSDIQLTAGETYQFGLAFWDPYEMEVEGWTEIGHYVTGCGQSWIDLELGPEATAPSNKPATSDGETVTGSAVTSGAVGAHSMLAAAGALFAAVA